MRRRSALLSGSRPTPIFEGRVGFGRVAVVAVGVARRDQQRAVADHLGQPVQHPFRIARLFDASRQPDNQITS